MKWGILATGTIAKKFASTVEQMGAEGEQLVAVGSRHMESAQAFAQQYGIPRCYDSYEALAADPEVEAIYVATPNTLHYENCKLCLEQGKHVLCEKPFTISPEQAQGLYRLAEEKHLFLMEAFWIWLLPLYDRLRQLLATDTIGELKQITCQYGFVASGARKDRKFDSGLGGGALLDIGIYNLGFLRILTGQDPEKVETREVHRRLQSPCADLPRRLQGGVCSDHRAGAGAQCPYRWYQGQYFPAGFPARRDHDAGSGGQRAGGHPLPGGHQRL